MREIMFEDKDANDNANANANKAGVYFFDGEKVMNQCTEYDDYGTISKEFKFISGFHINYWSNPMECVAKYVNVDNLESQFYWHYETCLATIDIDLLNLREELMNNKEGNTHPFVYKNEKYLLVGNGREILNGDKNCRGAVWVGPTEEVPAA